MWRDCQVLDKHNNMKTKLLFYLADSKKHHITLKHSYQIILELSNRSYVLVQLALQTITHRHVHVH